MMNNKIKSEVKMKRLTLITLTAFAVLGLAIGPAIAANKHNILVNGVK
jgi:hypothetical protein